METIRSSIKGQPNRWWASELMEHLEYKDWGALTHLIEEAVHTMITVGIPYYYNVIPLERKRKGKPSFDFQLTRFACYLVVLYADRKKAIVAETQDQFFPKAEKYGLYLRDFLELQRAEIRHELTEATKSLTSRAARNGAKNFPAFNDAGYQGMYNLHTSQLHDKRLLPKDHNQLEFMGRTELSANLLRITLTEEEIYRKKVNGQAALEQAHFRTGQDIRKLVKANTGLYPEQLPVKRELAELKKQLKQGYQNLLANTPEEHEHRLHKMDSK